jgi:hypothetical protein
MGNEGYRMSTDIEYTYKFTEFPTGFEITGRERHPVKVELQDHCFVINNKNDHAFGLYKYYDLSAYIAEELMTDWKSDSLPLECCGQMM